MAYPVPDSYSCAPGGVIVGGRYVGPRGVIALSAQGASDPFAVSPPAQFPTYPVAPAGGSYGAKHQTWAFDSDHGDFIVGGGDSTGDSQLDLFTYNAATKQFARILSQAEAGGGGPTFDHSITYLGVSNGGSGYQTSGYFPNYTPGMPGVPLLGGTGTGASAAIHTWGGAVDSCVIFNSGYGYTVGDLLTAAAADLGNPAGSGFTVTVGAVSPAGTPSSIVGPMGRCLAGYAYDATRHVMWMEGGAPRAGFIYPNGFANNLLKGGLWALDRSVTPPVWHRQGPGVGESAIGVASGMRYDNYSSGLYFDAPGDALYVFTGSMFKYSLNGISIDDVSRDTWSALGSPYTGDNRLGYSAYDSRRRRIILWSQYQKKTFAWNCATDTYEYLSDWDPPFNNDWHMSYDANADRIICWIAGQYGGAYDDTSSPGYHGDYQGRRTHLIYQMDPAGNWTSFTPSGDQLIAADCKYVQVSGEYDPVNKCTVILAGNEASDADNGNWFSPHRLVLYHLSLSPGQSDAPSITGTVWTPARDGFGNVLAGNWQGLPLNTWVDAGTAVLNDVIETPHYLNGYLSDGAPYIVNAWNGAAYDYINQRIYYFGGGHGDSSICETGIYKLDIPTMRISLAKPRDALSQAQTYDTVAHALVPRDVHNGFNAPLLNGNPGIMHTYHGLVWIPPSVMGAGNVNGGMFYGSMAKGVFNFDTGTWSATHYWDPDHNGADWSNVAAFLDGSKLWGPSGYWYHWNYDLTQNEVTNWGALSFGNWNMSVVSADKMSTAGNAAWGWIRERRETFSFGAGGSRTRTRYGQAIDASATNWTSYTDDITLTSIDGSHTDFNGSTLAEGAALCNPGVEYDPDTSTLYMQSNNAGGLLYKITGLSGNTWTTEWVAGTGALRGMAWNTYGRMRMATLGGKNILFRLSNTTTPVEVMRIS